MKPMPILLPLFSAATLLAADPRPVVEAFPAGAAYREPDRDAPPATSRMFVRQLDAAAAAKGISLPATGDGGMIILLLPVTKSGGTERATATLRTPTGDALRSGDAGSESRGIRRFAVDAAEGLGITAASRDQEVIHVARTTPAPYALTDVRLPAGATGMLVVAGEPESALTMTTTAGPLSRMPGQPVTLRATLRDGDDAVTGAHVVAHLAPSSRASESAEGAVDLFDDGLHGDGAKNDGVYAATVDEFPSNEAGFWRARYDASGTSARGVEFERSGSSELMNERASARLEPASVHATVDGDVLRVSASANVSIAGQYRYDVIIASRRDANGERRGIASGEAMRQLDRGPAQLALDVPLSMLGGASADELFLDVRLLNLDVLGVAGRVTVLPAGERGAHENAPAARP
jgi:hypothetical protein